MSCRSHLLQVFRRFLQSCFAVTLQQCFYRLSSDFPSGGGDNDRTFIFSVPLSMILSLGLGRHNKDDDSGKEDDLLITSITAVQMINKHSCLPKEHH